MKRDGKHFVIEDGDKLSPDLWCVIVKKKKHENSVHSDYT